jgi:4-amino-4-deoxy-L-arabinose transferase-like glycosyltransferase
MFVTTLCVLLAGMVAHIELGQLFINETGPLPALKHIFDLTLALSLLIFVLVVGYSICKTLGLSFASSAETLSFSVFVGTGALASAVLFLGLVHLLRSWAVAALVILGLGLSSRNLTELWQLIKRGLRAATLTRETRILFALFCCLIILLVLRALTPPNTADELIYHLPVSKNFAERGGIYPSYDNLFGNLPLLIHMIYTLCLMAGSDVAAKLFSLFLAIATAIALYGFCSRFLTRRVGVIAIFAFFGAGMVVEVAVTARIDVSLAGMLFLATYAMMNYLQTDQRGWLWVSAILAGFSLGIKSSAGPWLFFVGVMYIVETLRKRENITSILRRGIAYTFIAAAIASPWYIKNYVWFHNPIYPFITGEVADFGANGIRYFNASDESKLDAHFATARKEIPEIVNAQEKEIRQAIDARLPRHPMRLWEFFTKPALYLVSEPFHYPNYLFLLTPLVLFLRPGRWILWLLGISIAFAFTMTWSSWIARYLMPVYPSLTVVAAFTLADFSKRLNQRIHWAERLPVWATAISLSLVVIVSLVWVSEFSSLSYISGVISRRDFLLQFPFYHRIDFINTQLPVGSQVLAVGAHMNYGIQQEYLTDESWFATKWRRLLVRNDSLSGVNQDLHRQGFTHVLYCSGPFTYEATLGIKGSGGMDLVSHNDVPQSEEARILGPEYQLLRNWSTFTLYREKFLETMYKDESNCEVLRIK